MKPTLVYRVNRAFLWLAWPSGCFAANNALSRQFEGYTLSTIGILFLLISVGGLTGMLHRLQVEYKENGELQHAKLFIASNFLGAVVAGLLALLFGEGSGSPGWLLAIAILVSSFAGTLLVERVWQWFAGKYLPTEPTTHINEHYKPPENGGNDGKYD